MRYRYLEANEGDFTFREDKETDHAEEEARQACAKLNGSGP
ncbi:hypothetical protein [Billgrantia saliphila]|nr:hypothetical protein [Halomonas saliphila]